MSQIAILGTGAWGTTFAGVLADAGNDIVMWGIDTDAIKYFPNRERLLEEFSTRSQLGRELTASDVADVAYLLCLPEAEAIRGQTIAVDAGFSVTG